MECLVLALRLLALLLLGLTLEGVHGCVRYRGDADAGDTNTGSGHVDGEVNGAGPKKGTYMCVTKQNVIMKTTACGDAGIRVSKGGNCFKFKGLTKTCSIKGVKVNYYVVDYHGKDRMIGKAYLTGSTDDQCDLCPLGQNKKLKHAEAKAALDKEGITIVSSGGCSTRTVNNCTSLENVNCLNIKGAIWLKRTSKATVVVTGGTETGHSPGTYSHWEGYKLDIRYRNTEAITKFILKNFLYIGIRNGDEALKYRDPNGFEYNYEWKGYDHWDILYPKGSSIKSGSSGYSGANGKSMCITGSGVTVRKSDCSISTTQVSKPKCYTSKGENMICVIKQKPYNMHKLDLDDEIGWVASNDLAMEGTE